MTTTTDRIGDYIQMNSGGPAWPLDLRPEDIHIEDIAIGLAHQCRFTGQSSQYWSIADHSLAVAKHAWSETKDPLTALWGLMHDAAEAYIGDEPSPNKPRAFYFTGDPSALDAIETMTRDELIELLNQFWAFKEVERRANAAIFERFGFEPTAKAIGVVKAIDLRMLATEVKSFMPPNRAVWDKWIEGVQPYPDNLRLFKFNPTLVTRLAFLGEFRKLIDLVNPGSEFGLDCLPKEEEFINGV